PRLESSTLPGIQVCRLPQAGLPDLFLNEDLTELSNWVSANSSESLGDCVFPKYGAIPSDAEIVLCNSTISRLAVLRRLAIPA
ncbi:hypothetical protein Ciccas_013893, partial [Cichlidogyrus casuarinus]